MYYCGKDCQRLDWITKTRPGHKHDCLLLGGFGEDSLRKLHERFFPFLRLLTNVKFEPRLRRVAVKVMGIDLCYDDLKFHSEQIKQEPSVFAFHHILTDFGLIVPFDEVLEAYGKYIDNSLPISNPLGVDYMGEGLYLESSIFDHSCVPNANKVFLGTRHRVRATKIIPTSQPVTIAYVNYINRREVVQKLLKEEYHFECDCTRCSAEKDGKWEHTDDLEELLEHTNETPLSLSGQPRSRQVEHMERMVHLTEKIYGPFNENITALLRQLFVSKLPSDINECERNRALKDELEELYHRLAQALRVSLGQDHPLYQQFMLPGSFEGYLRVHIDLKTNPLCSHLQQAIHQNVLGHKYGLKFSL